MSELVLATLLVFSAGFAHASTTLNAQESAKAVTDLQMRWEREQSLPEMQRTILRDAGIEATLLSDGKTDCVVRPAHGTDTLNAECTLN